MLAWTFTTVLDHERRPQVGEDPLGHLAGVVGVLRLLEEDGELVAAEAGRGVTGPQRPYEPPATATSSSSPAAWPRLSLTSLKSSRSRNSTASDVTDRAGPGQGVLQPVAEQGTVGQPAQGVVERLVLELLLEPLALGHVTQREDDPFDGGVAEQVVGDHFDVAPRPVADAGCAIRPLSTYRPGTPRPP